MMTLSARSYKFSLCFFFILFIFPLSFAQNNQEEINRRKEKANELYDNKNFSSALVEYLEVIKLGGDPFYLYNIAICYKSIGDLYSAQRYFNEYKKEDGTAKYTEKAEELLAKIEKDIILGKSNTPSSTQKNARNFQNKAAKLYDKASSLMSLNSTKAQALFSESAKNYTLSYGQEPDSWKLYNAAQAYRLSGNEPDSTLYYNKFIEVANKNPNFVASKASIEKAMKHLETLQTISNDNLDRLPEVPLPPLPAPLPGDFATRRRWPWVAVASAVIVGGVGVAFLLRR
jgi:tetratricopeptide (TPR) repeat protein